jgi:hypothetical protein
MKLALLGLMLMTIPAVTLAQPAPIHNPVVARMPCTMGVSKVRMGAYEAKSVRASYDFGGVSAGQSGWAKDVRREIALGFNSLCN